ncbi:YdeI/OmpD-associated family protein [Ramlibacter sp. PS4R-6]|uniref:YdeI/OmpD-associated family protein n=1 Tax=Ramlibacter sp. PS4R-6 TaxID=3133438 RepID=UPI0030B0DC0A
MGTTDPRIDAYIAKSAGFARPILEHLRKTVHAACPPCEETVKWGMPFFTYNGRPLANMAAFKAHCAFGFWNRLSGDEAKGKEAMGEFGRIESLRDLPPKTQLAKMVKAQMALIDAGQSVVRKPKHEPKPPPEAPAELLAALKKNAAARRTYEAFPPSHKREYVEWIVEAKRDETRQSRLAQAIEWMAEGKPRHWKYQR